MRLVLVNPHLQNFGKMVSGVLLRRKSFLKYDYIIDFCLRENHGLAFCIDGSRNSFGVTIPYIHKIFALGEIIVWMLINRIPIFTVPVYLNTSRLNPQNDILLDFSRSIVDIAEKNVAHAPWSTFSGIVIIHFTHYFKSIKKLSERLHYGVQHCLVVAEGNIGKNEYFKKFFPFIPRTYHLPFVFAHRFTSRTPYTNRKNKCLAIGSITRVNDPEFNLYFGDPEGLHPMRKIIHANYSLYKNEIDSVIIGFEDTTDARKVVTKDSILLSAMKKYLPFFIFEKFYPTPQINYFKFDIVQKFNEYKMFVCPEEVVGLPSINAFEGMACKCAYVGIDDLMYSDIHMIPGVHYIAYKAGDVEDLLEKIRYYQNKPDELQRIAENGYEFVRTLLDGRKVASVFWNDLELISAEFRKSGKVHPICSFTDSSTL